MITSTVMTKIRNKALLEIATFTPFLIRSASFALIFTFQLRDNFLFAVASNIPQLV